MIRNKWRDLSRFRKRLFAGTLAVAVISTGFNIGSFAVNADTDKTVITEFAELPPSVRDQTIPLKGSLEDVRFPSMLYATALAPEEPEEKEGEATPTPTPAKEKPEQEEEKEPTAAPTEAPAETPTETPAEPTAAPTEAPAETPTAEPTQTPAEPAPTETPAEPAPTETPSEPAPTEAPSETPAPETSEPSENHENEPAEPPAPEPAPAQGEETVTEGSLSSLFDLFFGIPVYAEEPSGTEEEGNAEFPEGEGGYQGEGEPAEEGEEPVYGGEGEAYPDTGDGEEMNQTPEGEQPAEGNPEPTGEETPTAEPTAAPTEAPAGTPTAEPTQTPAEPAPEENEIVIPPGSEALELTDVEWELDREKSPYGSVFQAAVEGDVFYFVPDIDTNRFELRTALPEIRVTIGKSEKEPEEKEKKELPEKTVSGNELEKTWERFTVVGGVRVTLEASEGVFPEDAILVVRRVDGESERNKMEQVILSDRGIAPKTEESLPEQGQDGEVSADTAETDQPALQMLSFDISVMDGEGSEIQPNTEYGAAKVTFSDVSMIGEMGDDAEFSVYHFNDGLESAVSMGAEVNTSDNSAAVTTDHFSTFTLVTVSAAAASGISVTDIVSSKSDLGLIKGQKYTLPKTGATALGSTFSVVPDNATKQAKDIVWTLKDQAGNTVTANPFTADADAYTLSATIPGGNCNTKPATAYTKSPPFSVICSNTALVIKDLEYFKLQAKDEIDGYMNRQEDITIFPDNASSPKYLILDKFISSKDELKDTKYKWSDYDKGSKPGLFRNQANYIYVKIGNENAIGNDTWISSRCIIEDEVKPTIDSVKATMKGTQATVNVVGGKDELSGIKTYYIIAKKSSDAAPKAADIVKKGVNAASGTATIKNLNANTAYTFYAVAVDKAGNISEVKSSDMKGSVGLKIRVEDKEYNTLQGKETVDACYKEQKDIYIEMTTQGVPYSGIQYYISNKFFSSTSALEKEVNGAWSDYDPNSRPALKMNQLNYIYAKVTPLTEGVSAAYVSSKGIWEDEKQPKVSSAKATPKETSATVTVKGTDGESGVKTYYAMVKGKSEDAPKAKDVKDSGKKSDEGQFSFDGLSPKTDYMVYAVVEDKAGNLSEVRSTKLTTKQDKSQSGGSKPGGGSASGSSAGGAGSKPGGGSSTAGGSGASGAGGSNVDARTAEAEAQAAAAAVSAAEEKVRDRIPYIRDASQGIPIGRELTSGWDRIERETAACNAPAQIMIDMNGSTVVPRAMLHDFSERDVTCYFEMDDTVTWVLNGLSYTELVPDDIDFRVRLDTKNIPAQKINAIADVYPHVNLSLSHDGIFGFTALMRLNVGEDNKGMYANLYYYDEDKKDLEYVNSSCVDNNGYAEFEFTHASDYTVIIRGDALTASSSVLTSEAGSDGDANYIHSESMQKNNSSKIWLIVISALSILLCIIILVAPDDRKKGAAKSRA